jgi:hypothetical protein
MTTSEFEVQLEKRFAELKAAIYRALFVQALAIIGLTVSLVKLLP